MVPLRGSVQENLLLSHFRKFRQEKNLRTMWTELTHDYPEVFNLCSAQSLWFTSGKREMEHPLTSVERETLGTGVTLKTMTEVRLWNKRPDGISIKIPREDKLGEFVILEFKRMSDVIENYLTRVKEKEEGQYMSSKSVLERSLGPQGWVVKQVSFIAGARSMNDQDLRKKLGFYKVPQSIIESIRSKLDVKIFDEYDNFLKDIITSLSVW